LHLPVVIGDMAAGTTLDGLRLGSARALLAVTKDDMANLQCALLSRARAPGRRVVLRMFDPDLAARVERTTGIYLSRSVSALAASAFVAAIFGHRTEAVLPIGADGRERHQRLAGRTRPVEGPRIPEARKSGAGG
jgi:Trk K+ transport system NAD-binding subunit